jgi:hypothetical protein
MNGGLAGVTGAWAHSFEEDEGNIRVYRPIHSFAFPPSRRGRDSLEFGAAGQVMLGVPGPDDRNRRTPSRLTSVGMNQYRLESTMGASMQVIEVIEATPAILKLRFL